MELKSRIESDLKAALKGKDALKASALRMVIAAVKNKEIEERGLKKIKPGDGLDDAGVIRIIAMLAKQRQESIEMFKKGGRDDLAKKEADELKMLEGYLPSQLTAAEVEKIVDEVVKESGAAGPKDMGNVMKLVMPKIAGRADGKLVNEIVRKKLT